MDIIDNIRRITKEKGWSISYLCEQMGVARVYFNDIKKSGRQIPSDRLSQIASILNVSVDYLLGKTDIKKFPTESSRENRNDMEREYHELFALLTPDSRQELKAFLSLSPEQRKAVLALAQANRPDKE